MNGKALIAYLFALSVALAASCVVYTFPSAFSALVRLAVGLLTLATLFSYSATVLLGRVFPRAPKQIGNAPRPLITIIRKNPQC